MVPVPRRLATFEPRHRSLPLGIRRRRLAEWPREIRLTAAGVAAEAAEADYKPAGDEHIQLWRV